MDRGRRNDVGIRYTRTWDFFAVYRDRTICESYNLRSTTVECWLQALMIQLTDRFMNFIFILRMRKSWL